MVNNNKSMIKNKKALLYTLGFMLALVLINYVSATTLESYGTKKVNEQFTFCQVCADSTYITLSSIETPNSTINVDTNMTLISSGQFCYNYTPTKIGRYDFRGISDGCEKTFATYVDVNATGSIISPVMISIYILFLLVCIGLIFLSGKLIAKYSIAEDLKPLQQYELKSRSNFLFYLNLFKQKLWILGVFGVYLSILLFSTTLNQLLYDLGIVSLSDLLISLNMILLWGLIPFVIFWFVYIIIYFYKSTENILKYQFGGFLRER